MQLIKWIIERIQDLIHKMRMKKPKVQPYRVDRNWIAVERDKVDDEMN